VIRRRAALLLGALAATALRAETYTDLGATLTLAKPVADIDGGTWIPGRAARGFGLRLPWHFQEDQALVPRIDVMDLGTGPVHVLSFDNSYHLYTVQAKVRIQTYGLDYQWYFHRNAESGGYLLGGLAWSQGRFSDAVQVPGGIGGALPDGGPWPGEQVKKTVQYGMGGGWKLSQAYGVEFRFTQSTFRSVGTAGTVVKAPMFGISFTAEF
jgi:hypothetical protein